MYLFTSWKVRDKSCSHNTVRSHPPSQDTQAAISTVQALSSPAGQGVGVLRWERRPCVCVTALNSGPWSVGGWRLTSLPWSVLIRAVLVVSVWDVWQTPGNYSHRLKRREGEGWERQLKGSGEEASARGLQGQPRLTWRVGMRQPVSNRHTAGVNCQSSVPDGGGFPGPLADTPTVFVAKITIKLRPFCPVLLGRWVGWGGIPVSRAQSKWYHCGSSLFRTLGPVRFFVSKNGWILFRIYHNFASLIPSFQTHFNKVKFLELLIHQYFAVMIKDQFLCH